MDRILPGRDDVYIIPQSSCEDGKLLRESDNGRYYSNANIMACLVLKPPEGGALAAPTDSSLRVVCSTAYDAHEGTTNVQMAALADDERVSDELDGSVFPPRVLRCTATIARYIVRAYIVMAYIVMATIARLPTADYLALHQQLARENAGRRHWLENVARFKPAEMAAGVEGIRNQLLRAYHIAYAFMSTEQADEVCAAGGIAARAAGGGAHSLTVCLRSPAELGWQKNAGGRFRQEVAAMTGMAAKDVQVVVIVGVPSRAIEAAGGTGAGTFTIDERADEPKLLVRTDGGGLIYSGAHIAKIYALEPSALTDMRRDLVKASGDVRAELERNIRVMTNMLR